MIEENIQEYVDEFSFEKRKINLDIKTIRDTNTNLNNNIDCYFALSYYVRSVL